jgi:SAM-dependent methyltransferase
MSDPRSSRSYDHQQIRGSRAAYRRYLAGMNASMRQKVALTAAHLLCEGRVADMGMGSGAGSFALAALYPGLDVVGVDMSPTMVELAREDHVLPNLSFVVGDIAQPVFEDSSLDGIFDSSVLHHVTTFTGYSYEAAARCLEVQVSALKRDGALVVRDFLAPPDGDVLLDLPDVSRGDTPQDCSVAQLFERFSREFRPLSAEPGFALDRVGPVDSPLAERVIRYRTTHRRAVEFVLRKDYRRDWETEVKEEYTYFSQPEFEALFARLGLRVVCSAPIRNPWIVANRYVGKFELRSVDGAPMELPPTNYIIVGERVADGDGVRFDEEPDAAPVGFLHMEHWADGDRVMDLVRRPHLTVDMLPWFERGDDVYVLARKSYPRPILGCQERGPRLLDGRAVSTYVTEPLAVFQEDLPLGLTVEAGLSERAGIQPEQIRRMQRGATYYPSPGGVQEEVRSILVEIDPVFVERELEHVSGFSTSGVVRAIEARQLLRSAQVGGLPDARLEMNVYALVQRRGLDAGPWIGAEVALSEGPAIVGSTMAELAGRGARRRFVAADRGADFLEIRTSTFIERAADGGESGRRTLEYVLPGPLSVDTVATAPLLVRDGQTWIGIDDYDLPAAQCFTGNSDILVSPAWRLPRSVGSLPQAIDHVRGRLRAEYGVVSGRAWELGGPYHPSSGVTPEVVYPLAFEVTEVEVGERPITWVRLQDAVQNADQLVDGHLRIVAFRAAHALGLI